MWQSVAVEVGSGVVRGRYRLEGDQLVLEWRGGRAALRYGLVRPELVASTELRQLAEASRAAA
jgi:hypothetical protein